MQKITTLSFGLIVFLGLTVLSHFGFGQAGILNPADPIVVYNPAAPPATPSYGTVAKWVKTNRLSFNTSSFKAYFYKGVAFRLKFPKTYQHGVVDGKTYPVYLFFHGRGEKGSIYDNEFQLYHGGQTHMNAVDNGKFDGFLLYPQTSASSGYFNDGQYAVIREFIENYMVPQVKADPFRIIVDGLSGGGSSTWAMTYTYPTLVAASLPISGVSVSHVAEVQKLKWTPIWLFQGGLDRAPDPATAQTVVDAFRNAGGNISYTLYPNLGHGCWNAAWAEANYFPYLNKAHKANPWPLNGRTEFCPGTPISATMGVTAGFAGYEWRKNGVLIPGATSNSYTATEVGVYDCRILRGTTWSPWSPTPVEIKIKGATIPPVITQSTVGTRVLPAPDGSTSLQLEVPEGYASYSWVKEGSSTVLSTRRDVVVSAAGNYKVQVLEQFGCASEFSAPFTVIDANGAGGPSAPASILATTISKTEVRLSWNQNPAPANNETGFEVYKALASDGPYEYVGVTNADATNYLCTGLNPNTNYFFKVRAISLSGAGLASEIASAKTQQDNSAPSAPRGLRTGTSTRNSVELYWDEAVDDVGILKYEIFVNGVKYYESELPNFTVFNLTYGQQYAFTVRAIDLSGNISPMSNQVSAQPLNKGLNFKYYTFAGNLSNLPDFNTMEPAAVGTMPNVSINNRTQEDRIAYLWEGFINIPVTGQYTFTTSSDDGSKLYIGNYSHTAVALVNNDGLHGTQPRSGTITLTAGTYPIAITYFEMTGGQAMSVSWTLPGTTTSVAIPNSAFEDQPQNFGNIPVPASGLQALAESFKTISLQWTDNSDNESGYEIWRSSSALGGFKVVNTVGADVTSYKDSIGLSPGTPYYYKVRGIGQLGESKFAPVFDAEANWKFESNLADETANSKSFTSSGTVAYDSDNEKEGDYAMVFNGTNTHLDFNTVAGDYLRGAYATKSVSFWMRSNNNTGNRIVLDIGGSDNGLSVRLDASRLYAGVASNNVRRNISVPYTSTGWNHIAVVYSAASLKLYVNGVLQTSNNSLGFSIVNATTNLSRLGTVNGSNAFNTGSGRFSGAIDNLAIFAKALTDAEVSKLANETYLAVFASTANLPAPPATPTELTAVSESASSIRVTWTDNANDETHYEILRSEVAGDDFVLVSTLPVNSTSFIDQNLFANSSFKYKVRAVNIGGYSEAGPVTGGTSNNIPVIAEIPDQFVKYGTQVVLNILASDPDPGLLNLQVSNLPSFATFTSTGNGVGEIVLNPSESQVGVYSGITITATDDQGASSVETFNLTVYGNNSPVLTAESSVSLNEKAVRNLTFTATDADVANTLSWTFTGLPSFATVSETPGTAVIALAPGYADAGTYSVFVRVDDGENGFDTATVSIEVKDVDPNRTVFVNFTAGTYLAPSPWNNTNKSPANNDVFANLIDTKGALTPINIQLVSGWSANASGANTGNNSGVYPDNVLRSSYFTGSTASLRVRGLDPNYKYSYTMLGSRANPGFGVVTTYSIGGTTVSVDAANNSTRTASINGVVPAADGTSTLTVGRASGSTYGYLNSVVIKLIYRDGTVPVVPKGLTASILGTSVRLRWQDVAYNEEKYEVFRSLNSGGPFVKVNADVDTADMVEYVDGTVVSNTLYYYKVRAVNDIGSGEFSEVVSVSTPNLPPVISAIANVNMDASEVRVVQVIASDPGDVITLVAGPLPQFITFIDNGNGSGTFTINPANAFVGQFNGISVTARDGQNATSSLSFNVNVTSATLVPPPTAVRATAVNRSSIRVTWTAPPSVVPTLYEVYSSASANGLYAKVGEVSGSTLQFVHSGLTASTQYYYKIKTVSNGTTSGFSTYGGAFTVSYVVNLNMNDGSTNGPAQPGNWNNINTVAGEGFVLSNMINDEGLNTGIDLEFTKPFSGFNIYGTLTGNNSGVYPDNVIKSFYYSVYGDSAYLTIRDLNLAHTYSFVFFGSRANPSFNVVTGYRVGDKVVTLNAANNTANTVQIDGIIPQPDGTARITLYATTSGGLGYLNALTIYGAPKVASDPSDLTAKVALVQSDLVSNRARDLAGESNLITAKAYPNPFVSGLSVEADIPTDVDKLTVVISDLSGKLLFKQEFKNVRKGRWSQKLNIGGGAVRSGVLIMNIYDDKGKFRTPPLKIVKQ